MKITPLDIQQQQFKGKVFGGLNPEEVDTFLQLVAKEVEELVRENGDLKEQVRKAAIVEEEMTQREREIRETLLAAQRVIEEMKNNAQKEAGLIVAEAEIKADKLVADSENRLVHLNSEIQELRRQKLQFESSLKSLLDSYYKMLSLNEE
ncbi:MAG TPA: DivIVA domain-containing protein [Geobacteraceae bacterium]|nr:DivIVA domain-containing protein [Geobacteraceae bacterium]